MYKIARIYSWYLSWIGIAASYYIELSTLPNGFPKTLCHLYSLQPSRSDSSLHGITCNIYYTQTFKNFISLQSCLQYLLAIDQPLFWSLYWRLFLIFLFLSLLIWTVSCILIHTYICMERLCICIYVCIYGKVGNTTYMYIDYKIPFMWWFFFNLLVKSFGEQDCNFHTVIFINIFLYGLCFVCCFKNSPQLQISSWYHNSSNINCLEALFLFHSQIIFLEMTWYRPPISSFCWYEVVLFTFIKKSISFSFICHKYISQIKNPYKYASIGGFFSIPVSVLWCLHQLHIV